MYHYEIKFKIDGTIYYAIVGSKFGRPITTKEEATKAFLDTIEFTVTECSTDRQVTI